MRYRQLNHKGEHTISGVFDRVVDDLREDIKSFDSSISQNKSEHVNVATFTRVINLYFKYWLEAVIKEKMVMTLHNKMGYLFVIKTNCIRYTPTSRYFITENGKTVMKEAPVQMRNGMRPMLFWDTAKKYRMFKFELANKWKKMIYELFFDELEDYPEMSLENYGRAGSKTYIQHLK